MFMYIPSQQIIVMVAKEKLVAASEAGFISVKSLISEKPRGTFDHLV